MEILLIAGGTVDSEQLKEQWRALKAPYVIGVDRGAVTALENNIKVDKSIGDFDSVSEAERVVINTFSDVEELCPEKDDTDTEHALRFALSLSPEKIIMMGCTGSRLDQTFASIRLLKLAKDKNIDCCILDLNNRIRVEKGTFIITKKDIFGKYISVLPFGDIAEGIKETGFKYEVNNLTLTAELAQGVSNELVKDVGMISCKDYFIVMETRD
ncbi:MAG: thiamine diphosphokinase [Eubacterium sp.]|nr:thiamine diphosphokinase [Eubacterium sp.]